MTHPRIIPLAQTETSRYHVRDAGGTAALNHGPERTVVDLADLGWRFACGHGDEDILEPSAAAAPDCDDSEAAGWEPVTLPHTWNARDTNDGVRGNMNRTVGWYRAHLHVVADNDTNVHKAATAKPGTIIVSPGRRTYLEFDGVNSVTSLYVNGHALAPLGSDPRDVARDTGDPAHLGGYAMFRFYLTDALHAGDNVIAVRVDNRRDLRVAPLFADFNFYGGIYRPARLVQTADVHLALDDRGSSGLRIVTPNAGRSGSVDRPDHLGLTEVHADIVNDADRERRVLARHDDRRAGQRNGLRDECDGCVRECNRCVR
ncbi:sugar-binding domain-containing protein [Bifidobacterium sp. SO1]|uniref:sugar-binding domain-containing protein n=1 Tax=Bifidobacterium sp. SO1 TaxID=2809029 RepID=UPI001BDCE04E|nr:sugar-binding domain-containing protein [Bifidobacterium sp. SO1]MBT1160645.1 hypothetical protein [Bifidobacterium sp. SO1]